MQTNNITKEQISNMRSIIGLVTSNKVCHLRKPIHNKKLFDKDHADDP
jgi:hypothetical protein